MAASTGVQAKDSATAVVATIEKTSIEAANTGTVGLYFVREHVQQSLPAVLHARTQLQQTAATAADATYAANHSREFAASMRTALPASLQRMEARLRDASWAAAEVARQQRARQQQEKGGAVGGGVSSLVGSLVPQQLLGYLRGSGTSAGSSGNGMYG